VGRGRAWPRWVRRRRFLRPVRGHPWAIATEPSLGDGELGHRTGGPDRRCCPWPCSADRPADRDLRSSPAASGVVATAFRPRPEAALIPVPWARTTRGGSPAANVCGEHDRERRNLRRARRSVGCCWARGRKTGVGLLSSFTGRRHALVGTPSSPRIQPGIEMEGLRRGASRSRVPRRVARRVFPGDCARAKDAFPSFGLCFFSAQNLCGTECSACSSWSSRLKLPQNHRARPGVGFPQLSSGVSAACSGRSAAAGASSAAGGKARGFRAGIFIWGAFPLPSSQSGPNQAFVLVPTWRSSELATRFVDVSGMTLLSALGRPMTCWLESSGVLEKRPAFSAGALGAVAAPLLAQLGSGTRGRA